MGDLLHRHEELQAESGNPRSVGDLFAALQRLAAVVVDHYGDELVHGGLLEVIQLLDRRVPQDARLREICLGAADAWEAAVAAEEEGQPTQELYKSAHQATEKRREYIETLRCSR